MVNRIISLVILLTLAITVAAQDSDTEPNEVILHIAPYQQDCVGVAPQECLIVRFEDETDLSFFYDAIDGFTFEEGFEYTLRVNITEIENPPADASSLQYELVEIVQQFPAHLHGKIWELQSLYDTEIEDPSRYQFLLTDEGVSIKADCNSVGANFTQNPFDIETTFTTLVGCPEDSLELDYVAALNDVTMMSIENGELIMQSSEGQLRFAPPAMEGTEWTLSRVLGIAMMLELDESTPYTLLIEDGQASMQVLCNRATASIDFDGAVLSLSEVAITRAFCGDDPLSDMYPPENVVYYITDSDNLILEDDSGNLYEFVSTTEE